MADSQLPLSGNASGCFKEAVCIDANRIYDSCSDKDCLEDLQVYFCPASQAIIDRATCVKCRDVDIFSVMIDVEPIPFNRGFYSVDMTFYFCIELDAYSNPLSPAQNVTGTAFFCKKVVLYGSEGNVKVFCSDRSCDADSDATKCKTTYPKACVQVVDPICLGAKLCECQDTVLEPVIAFPECICKTIGGDSISCTPQKTVFVTLGLFSIVQIERKVQMLIPVYDFCIPDKECITNSDDPCELFKKIKFPTNEFFPPRLDDLDNEHRPVPGCCGE